MFACRRPRRRRGRRSGCRARRRCVAVATRPRKRHKSNRIVILGGAEAGGAKRARRDAEAVGTATPPFSITLSSAAHAVVTKKSVHERLGKPIDAKRGRHRINDDLPQTSASSSRAPPRGVVSRRVEKHHQVVPRGASGRHRMETGVESELDARIRRIQEQNAELLRRRQEVEADRKRFVGKAKAKLAASAVP
ncbi:PREDICTED: uncharacterized protein LOC106815201 [Priapulus caudatus]|uniref:Uncharacterized protein LOC106815201 n=1 Tax=Priapulus caudatus TaxID=37621 RepID=A0ABM1ESE6_PRICU|nr:PREDICTED: uncharacterized protein LOC106815201 [Priapulus caudatus]